MKKTTSTKILMLAICLVAIFQGKAQEWESMTPMPTPRAYTASCVLDGKIYVIGGTVWQNSNATTVVEAYDWEMDEWDTNIASLPVGLCDASAEVVDGKIYVIGGRPQFLEDGFDSVFVYDPATNVWTSQSMSVARASYASVVVGDSIFLAGGGAGDFPGDEVVFYHPASDTWTNRTSMPITPRFWHTATVAEGKIYTTGGIYLGVSRSLVQEYDPANDSWTGKTDMPDTKLNHGSGYIPMNHSIYVFGGIASFEAFSPGMWRYDIADDSWSDEEVEFPETISAFAYSAVEISDHETCLYAIGGALPGFWEVESGQYAADALYRYCIVLNPTREVNSAVVLHPQSYPNPFSLSTTIRYELENAAEVSLVIHDLLGQEVATLFTGLQAAGDHQFEWNAEGLPSGVYFYTLQVGEFARTMKLIKN